MGGGGGGGGGGVVEPMRIKEISLSLLFNAGVQERLEASSGVLRLSYFWGRLSTSACKSLKPRLAVLIPWYVALSQYEMRSNGNLLNRDGGKIHE